MKYRMYLRVSTDKQEDSGLGLEAQRHACLEWIKENGGGDYQEYIDIVTGTDKKRKELEQRPSLLEALSDLQKDDVLIVHKRERMGRDPYINGMIERLVEKKKARLVSAIGEMDGDEPHNILMRRIMDAFSEYEALLISTRTKLALARKKARGERVGHIPYGYCLVDGYLVINPEEQIALEKMHTYRVKERLPFRTIADKLNKQGYRNRSYKQRKPGLWTYGAIARVYKNYAIS